MNVAEICWDVAFVTPGNRGINWNNLHAMQCSCRHLLNAKRTVGLHTRNKNELFFPFFLNMFSIVLSFYVKKLMMMMMMMMMLMIRRMIEIYINKMRLMM